MDADKVSLGPGSLVAKKGSFGFFPLPKGLVRDHKNVIAIYKPRIIP